MQKKNKIISSRLVKSIALILLAFIFLLISNNTLVGVPKRVGLSILSLMQKGFDATGNFVASSINSIAELHKLQKNHDELLKQVEKLGKIERSYSELKQENERLLEQLGCMKNDQFVFISAKIIARDPENIYSTFILNKGTTDGVIKNQVVVSYQNGIEGLVGRITEVANTSCIVSPIYDASTFVSVKLARSRYTGLAAGSGNEDLPLIIKYVKKRAKDEIQYGDMVVTNEIQSLYPAGINVGRITKIRDFDYLTSLELEMEPVLDFGRIEYVFIIKNIKNSAGN